MHSPARQRSRTLGPWIVLRKVTQYLSLAAVFALVVGSGRAAWAGSAGSRLLQLDPLTTLASILAGRGLFPGATLALILVAITLLVGRSWCGWLCPVGTLLDIFPLRRWRRARRPPPETWRRAKYALLLLILFAALLTNLTLLFTDPLTLFVRTTSASLLPALDRLVGAAETGLYRVPALREGVKWVDDHLRPEILPRTPVTSRVVLLYGLLFIAVVGLNLLAERFWCRYLCPLGGLLGLMSKVGLIRRTVNQQCKGCELCTRACPTGTIRPESHYESDPAECTMCLECSQACPRAGIGFVPRLGPSRWNEYDPSRRQVLATLGVSVASVALLRTRLLEVRSNPYLVQPPGAADNDLLLKCIRCGACLNVCPTGGLQPSVAEAGIEGFWTPVLVSRMGYCHYSCNACGQACPVAAIPPLALEQKQQAVLGLAHIDQDRCLAWAENTPCIVCEEMCPLPEKAIVLEEPVASAGQPPQVLRPKVVAERCIGCGICEFKCPVGGEAAIRIQGLDQITDPSLTTAMPGRRWLAAQ